MLSDEGAKFVANCLLLILTCCLVCKEWDKLIMEEMWKTRSGRQKLLHRSKSADPIS